MKSSQVTFVCAHGPNPPRFEKQPKCGFLIAFVNFVKTCITHDHLEFSGSMTDMETHLNSISAILIILKRLPMSKHCKYNMLIGCKVICPWHGDVKWQCVCYNRSKLNPMKLTFNEVNLYACTNL